MIKEKRGIFPTPVTMNYLVETIFMTIKISFYVEGRDEEGGLGEFLKYSTMNEKMFQVI